MILLVYVILLIGFHESDSAIISYSLIVQQVPGNPDGYPRPVLAIFEEEKGWDRERAIPGPIINATLGDILNITVKNDLDAQSTSIHFHGLHMINNVWMDGVAGITQCPISAGSSFNYYFNVTQTGTYWYHSHKAAQYGDGILGPIILNYPPGEDPVFNDFPYESEYVIFLQDWYHESWDHIALALRGPYQAFPGFTPKYPWPTTSLLINGHGRFSCNATECPVVNRTSPCQSFPLCLPLREPFFGNCNSTAHEPDEFVCTGERIRLRLINGGNNDPLRIWIDRHNMTIVARDGVETVPTTKQFITINLSQRLDVIVECNQNSSNRYYIYVSLPPLFIPGPVEFVPKIFVNAFLAYPESETTIPAIISPTNVPANDSIFGDNIHFEIIPPFTPEVAAPAYKRIILIYRMLTDSTNNDPLESWSVNGYTFAMPTEPYLQSFFTDRLHINETLANYTDSSNNKHYTYVEHLEYGQIYEIVVVGNNPQQHPWHLHGYTLNFIAHETFNLSDMLTNKTTSCGSPIYDVLQVDLDKYIPKQNESVKIIAKGDSFTVPSRGVVVFRFLATNPGPWFFHCHIEWHLEQGLAVLISVEKNGTYDILDVPRNFPVCGSSFTLGPVENNYNNNNESSCEEIVDHSKSEELKFAFFILLIIVIVQLFI